MITIAHVIFVCMPKLQLFCHLNIVKFTHLTGCLFHCNLSVLGTCNFVNTRLNITWICQWHHIFHYSTVEKAAKWKGKWCLWGYQPRKCLDMINVAIISRHLGKGTKY